MNYFKFIVNVKKTWMNEFIYDLLNKILLWMRKMNDECQCILKHETINWMHFSDWTSMCPKLVMQLPIGTWN